MYLKLKEEEEEEKIERFMCGGQIPLLSRLVYEVRNPQEENEKRKEDVVERLLTLAVV